MKKTGELLKKTRESKGLSLHEIGLSLKINSKVLKAIEDDDQKNLPAKTFLRGFVQSYAQYLKLNMDEVMALFTEEMGSTRPAPNIKVTDSVPTTDVTADIPQQKNEAPSESIKISQRSEFQIKPILSGIVVVFLLGLIFMVKRMVDKYQKEAVVQTVQIDNPLPSETPAPQAATASAATDAIATASATPLPTSVAVASASTEDIQIEEPKASESLQTPTPSPAAKKPETKITETKVVQQSKPIETKTPEPSPTAEPKIAEVEKPKKAVELIVEAMDNVEIEYSSLTGKSGKIKLSAEQVHTFKSSNGLKLNIDNGGAINLILNGKDLGVPGELGKPVKLTY